VIHESSVWKDPLLTSARRFRRFQKAANMSELAQSQIERDVFIGFYSIRKLMEKPGALTDATRASRWQCLAYFNRAPVTIFNNHKLDELYDLSSQQKETKALAFLCNQVVHSFVFCTFLDETGAFDGVIFASDREKDSKLYRVSAETLIDIFRHVGKDYPSQVLFHRGSLADPFTVTAT
jgi:hypothetical protein